MDENKVALKSINGKYITADPTDGRVRVNRLAVNDQEEWYAYQSKNQVALMNAALGKWLSAGPDGTINCNRDQCGPYEKFQGWNTMGY